MTEFEDIHKYFVQFMLKNSCVTSERAAQYHTFLKDKFNVDDQSMQDLITQINHCIKKQGFKIVLITCEVTSTKFVVFKNLKSDNLSQKLAPNTRVELEYFQIIMAKIIEVPEHRISQLNCLHLATSVHGKLQQCDGETLIKKWVRNCYLVERDNHIYLGARTIEEFKPYFKTHYQDFVRNCNLCSEFAFWGQRCNSCEETMHFHCLTKFSQRICPNCKSDFEEDISMESFSQHSSSSKKKRKT